MRVLIRVKHKAKTGNVAVYINHLALPFFAILMTCTIVPHAFCCVDV